MGQSNFSASPTSGQAPLTVTFRTTTSPSTNNGTFTVDFGDGTTGKIKSDPNAPMGVCMEGAGGPCNGYNNLIANHTYPSDGTYNAKLMYQEPFGLQRSARRGVHDGDGQSATGRHGCHPRRCANNQRRVLRLADIRSCAAYGTIQHFREIRHYRFRRWDKRSSAARASWILRLR